MNFIFIVSVLVLIAGIIGISRNNDNGFYVLCGIIGAISTFIFFFAYFLSWLEMTDIKCSHESLVAKEQSLQVMREEVFNSDTVDQISNWIDTIEDTERSILHCSSAAQRVQYYGKAVSFNGLIPIYKDDIIPEHLRKE